MHSYLYAGVKRLEVLPLDESERYKRVRNGRIRKRNRSYLSSFSSSTSLASNVTAGTFVEKRGFTFKYGDRNKDGEDIGVIGIERNKRFRPTTMKRTSGDGPPVNINMNWKDLFSGIKECVNTTREPPKAINDSISTETEAVCDRLLALLQTKRAKDNEKKVVQQNISNIQGRDIIYADEDNPIVVDNVGDAAHTFKLPTNVRLIKFP